jgi:hypothetical protein
MVSASGLEHAVEIMALTGRVLHQAVLARLAARMS